MSNDLSSLDRNERLWRCKELEYCPPTSLHDSPLRDSPHRYGPGPRYFPRKPVSARNIHDYLFPIGPQLPSVNPEIAARQRAWAEVRAKHQYLKGVNP